METEVFYIKGNDKCEVCGTGPHGFITLHVTCSQISICPLYKRRTADQKTIKEIDSIA